MIGERSSALNVAPFIESSRAYVSIRFVSERLGLKVE
ncbi:stalk domain-containing protein [Paenibacillus sp. ACRRY]|nr:stalk domain-containing protein [Paenibacillus sp. ACRRY]MCG7381614.1 copper amine oxidase N-terminal domain-containing protein [Paenibacillus sp. ACRRY]